VKGWTHYKSIVGSPQPYLKLGKITKNLNYDVKFKRKAREQTTVSKEDLGFKKEAYIQVNLLMNWNVCFSKI
jgi:hypothetical protein